MRGRAAWLGLLALVLIVSAAPFAAADNPPEVVIDTPDHGSTVSGTVVISGRAGDDVGVMGVKVRIDTGEWMSARDTSPDGSWHTWALDWDTTTVPNGWHSIGAITWDGASQHADARIEVFVENPTEDGNRPPHIVIDEPPNHATVRGTVNVRGRSADPDANDTVELVQVRIDRGEWQNATPTGDNGTWNHWAFEWNTSTVPDGWHAFSARAFDGELWSDDLVFEYFVDNVHDENRAPFAEIVHPKHGDTVHGIVLIHGVAGDPDDRDRVELVQVRIGEGEWMRATDTSRDHTWRTWAFQWDTTTRENGHVRICARAFDGDLYSEPNCRAVWVANEHHNEPPKVSILHPTMGQKVSGLVLIHGRAWDDVGVKLVEIRFGEGEWLRTTDTSPDGSWTTWAYEWNTRDRHDGCLKIFARAYDGSLFSELAYVEVCVDNENDRPWAKILHPANGDTVHGLVLVHGTAGDDHGVKLVEVRIDDGLWDDAHDTGRDRPWSTWAYEWNTGRYENGKHHVCARAYDGELYGEPSCIVVIVHNEHDGGGGIILGAPEALGSAGPVLTLGLLGSLGVAMLMWFRSHGFLR